MRGDVDSIRSHSQSASMSVLFVGFGWEGKEGRKRVEWSGVFVLLVGKDSVYKSV